MDNRKKSFENNMMKKENQNIIIISNSPKENNLVKPDLSPIIKKQNQIGYKQFGSYKKQKCVVPGSPKKSPNFKPSTEVKGKNLFGVNQPIDFNIRNLSKKLNFDDCGDDKNTLLGKDNISIMKDFSKYNNKLNMFPEKCGEKDEEKYNINRNSNNGLYFIPLPKFGKGDSNIFNSSNNDELLKEKRTKSIRKCSINIENNKELLKNDKFDSQFKVLKRVKKGKYSTIYKVQEKKTNKVLCTKKIIKTSPKSNIDILKKITSDFIKNSNNMLYQFCEHYLDFWIEEEEFNPLLSDSNFSDKNLYLLTHYYENGDIFDFVGKLEIIQYNFTEDFYWDIIFEMIMGLLFVHECGYIHADIQPSNYLVDENGYLKLNDFSLAIKVNEICLLDDIIEGDSRYISQELFHFDKNSKLDYKCDIFSLGLTIFELIAKIELPYNGQLWHKIRGEDFKIENYFEKCNIKEVSTFISLISSMLLPFEKRPNLKELINSFSQLLQRYELLLKGKYQKSCNIPKFNDKVVYK